MILEGISGPAAQTIPIDTAQQASFRQPLYIGQAVRAEVLERLAEGRVRIVIAGVEMQASPGIPLAPGDLLHLTVCSTDPLVLQLRGMEYSPSDPQAAMVSAARLLGLAPDEVTRAILAHMMKREQKLSRTAVEEARRLLASLRCHGMTAETDEELLERIDELAAKDLPVTAPTVRLAQRASRAPQDIGRLSAALCEALEETAGVPDEMRGAILRYFTTQREASASLRRKIEMLGIDYEHSLVTWGIGAGDAPKSGSLKAALMKLVAWLEGVKTHGAQFLHLRSAAEKLLAHIESQQYRALTPAGAPGEVVAEIPFEIEGTLRTLRFSVTPEGGAHRMIGNALPRHCSFHMRIELSELGTISVAGRLAGRSVSAAIGVEEKTHGRMLEKESRQLTRSLRALGCAPVTLTVRTGDAAAQTAARKGINASA